MFDRIVSVLAGMVRQPKEIMMAMMTYVLRDTAACYFRRIDPRHCDPSCPQLERLRPIISTRLTPKTRRKPRPLS